ncbi:MAG: DUF4160 domain-containing protein [Gemmatimonadota bacterium]|nr:DUF4160 domain-containing protein [Gemmatimonadota bacterium]
MSPTIFRARGFRVHFYSREEIRLHVHVWHATGEAKFWLDPDIELAENHGLHPRQVRIALELIREHRDEIRSAWTRYFAR